MPILYLTEQGTTVRKSGSRLITERDGAVTLDLPCHKLENVLLFGNVQISNAALIELLDHGAAVGLFTRNGRFRGAVVPPAGKNVELRIAHFEAYRDPGISFGYAKAFALAKIENGLASLRRLAAGSPGKIQPAAIGELEDAAQAMAAASSIQAVDGVEGAAARSYFSLLMAFNRSSFRWPGRIKHPATDPINALLSLTYTLLTNELYGLLEGAGLDPYLGFLHQMDYGRPSLALDLVEPFRHPVADRFVLALLNQGIFRKEDFRRAPDREGLFLEHEPIKRYFAEYEHWMLAEPGHRIAFRKLLRREVEGFASAIRHHQPFSAFRQTEEEADS